MDFFQPLSPPYLFLLLKVCTCCFHSLEPSAPLSCSRTRLGRFTQDSVRQKKICGAVGLSDMPLFQGGVIHLCRKSWVALWEVLAPLYTKGTQSRQGANTDLLVIQQLHSTHEGPYSRPHEHYQVTVTWTSGWGSLTDSIFPTPTVQLCSLFRFQLKHYVLSWTTEEIGFLVINAFNILSNF